MSIYTPALGAESAAVLAAIAQTNQVNYDFGADQVDLFGAVIGDLTPYMVRDGNAVITRDCTVEVAGSLVCTLDHELVWGRDLVAPYMLVSSAEYQSGQQQRFNLGHYVATSPDTGLQTRSAHSVTGYEKLYLMQNQLGDSYLAAATTTYSASVLALMIAAGVIPSGGALADYVSFPGDWSTKTLPSDLAWPLDGTGTTYIAAINQLLKASGQQPLFTDQNGRYTVAPLPVPRTQGQQWTFAGTDTAFGSTTSRIVSNSTRNIRRDVYNVPNQWVFIQQGLSFAPVEGSGQYTVNNTGTPPADQTTVGRILRSVQFLTASGQDDLKAQGDAIVTAQLAQAEQITLQSAPWPAAWQYDVFLYTDAALPITNVRKVQSQQWRLQLEGGWMDWTTLVVAPQ